MKRVAIGLMFLFLFSVLAHAQTSGSVSGPARDDTDEQNSGMKPPCKMMMDGQKGDMDMTGSDNGGTMGKEKPMPMQYMLPMCQKHMMGQGMIMRDMMQTMVDMMKMQKKIIKGVSPAEKKELLSETEKMIDKMDQMMSDMRSMMIKGMMSPGSMSNDSEDQDEEDQVDDEGNPVLNNN